ncbi:MAG: O-antigen ligase family protein [Bacteroidales bacterium]
MFLNFAIILLLFSSFSNIKILNQKKYILVVLQLLFSIFIFLLSSKAGIISLIIIYLFYVSIIIFSQKRYKLALLILSSLLLFSIVFLTIMPSVKDRLKVAFYALKNKNEAIKSDGESTSDRILIWETSIDIIKRNLILGVGTGDVKDELLNKYKENGINFAYQQKLNAHNQYLQTFISIGLIGFIILILSFLLPVIQSIKRQHYIYLMFLFLIAFNILVESMFENQAGVVFYAFFNTFLFLSSKQLADN